MTKDPRGAYSNSTEYRYTDFLFKIKKSSLLVCIFQMPLTKFAGTMPKGIGVRLAFCVPSIVGTLNHQCFDDMYVSFFSVLVLRMLCLHMTDLLMEFNTHIVITGNKVVSVVCRRFKNNDDIVAPVKQINETRLQQLEAITDIFEFKWLHESSVIGRYDRCGIVSFGNVNVCVNREVRTPFHKA